MADKHQEYVIRQLKAIADVTNERDRQENKWGEQNHPPIQWMAILMEEVGEAAKEATDWHFGNLLERNENDDPMINDKNVEITREVMKRYRKEMVQVAAVAISMIECFDRNTGVK